MSSDTSNVETTWDVVHRVVFPPDRDADVLPLYVDFGPIIKGEEEEETTSGRAAARQDHDTGVVHVQPSVETRPQDVLSERSITVQPDARISLGSYFNAFPASYWRRWTSAERVRLRVRVTGEATVSLYRSNPRGVAQRLQFEHVTGGPNEVIFHLSLDAFGDGGWYWFDIAAGSDGATLVEADWSVPAPEKPQGTLTIAVTTFNRPDYCSNLLRTVSQAKHLMPLLDQIIVVDQGTQKVQQQPGFNDLSEALEGKLRIIDQANLGGSGGFARGMYETVKADRSAYVMLLDDDVQIDPESVLRALSFAEHCRRPSLVGGHMFDLYARSVLHTLGETVDRYRFFYSAAKGLKYGHDLATTNLRSTPWMHRCVDVDYNAWWMCLIPTTVIRQIGLALPVFIKWDDVEYGLRAGNVGFPTVTLPGAAVWHLSFGDKDDTVDWQAYYHQRNRLVAALLYSPYERGGDLLAHSFQIDVKHLLSMQYYAAELRLMGLEDVLKGPDHLPATLRSRLTTLRGLRAEFSDAQTAKDPDAFPALAQGKPVRKGRSPEPPTPALLLPWAAQTILRHLVTAVSAEARKRPRARLAHMDSKWWRLSQYDSVIVSTADGTAASWYKRDPQQLRRQLRRSVLGHQRLWREWPKLRDEYRRALPALTSFEAWEQHFALSGHND